MIKYQRCDCEKLRSRNRGNGGSGDSYEDDDWLDGEDSES